MGTKQAAELLVAEKDKRIGYLEKWLSFSIDQRNLLQTFSEREILQRRPTHCLEAWFSCLGAATIFLKSLPLELFLLLGSLATKPSFWLSLPLSSSSRLHFQNPNHGLLSSLYFQPSTKLPRRSFSFQPSLFSRPLSCFVFRSLFLRFFISFIRRSSVSFVLTFFSPPLFWFFLF